MSKSCLLHRFVKSAKIKEKRRLYTMEQMIEIKLNDNQTRIKVYINGEPDLSSAPKSIIDAFVSAIAEIIEKANK